MVGTTINIEVNGVHYLIIAHDDFGKSLLAHYFISGEHNDEDTNILEIARKNGDHLEVVTEMEASLALGAIIAAYESEKDVYFKTEYKRIIDGLKTFDALVAKKG